MYGHLSVVRRILSLEKLGVVFNQVATPLQYTPRKMTVHPPTSSLILIESDHNTFTDTMKAARKQQIAEVCVCVCVRVRVCVCGCGCGCTCTCTCTCMCVCVLGCVGVHACVCEGV